MNSPKGIHYPEEDHQTFKEILDDILGKDRQKAFEAYKKEEQEKIDRFVEQSQHFTKEKMLDILDEVYAHQKKTPLHFSESEQWYEPQKEWEQSAVYLHQQKDEG